MNFKKALINSINNTKSVTENGALGYQTSKKALVDINFATSSLRCKDEAEIKSMWLKAFGEDPVNAIVWIFFAGDVRGGMGERRLFRILLLTALEMIKDPFALIDLVPEYTRWDNLWCLIGTSFEDYVFTIVRNQLDADLATDRPSLLAKWLPSINASNKETKKLGKIFAKRLGLSEKSYRKMLSKLRKQIDVVEVKMSANEWNKVNYNGVPSKANLIYSNAFLKHDTDRREKYLMDLVNGDAKINASVTYPHEIAKVLERYDKDCTETVSYEEMWKSLPDYVKGDTRTLVMADTSGSMTCCYGSVRPIDVSIALALYYSERAEGFYKNMFLTFSKEPKLVDLTNLTGMSTRRKLKYIRDLQINENTDIAKGMRLLLRTAVENNLKQEELPNNLLIISDMEFDGLSYNAGSFFWGRSQDELEDDEVLFEVLQKEFKEAGYLMPRICFWNVDSRTCTVPIQENDLGIALISGYSPATIKMVLSGKLDPYECLIETLQSERYTKVYEAITKEVE